MTTTNLGTLSIGSWAGRNPGDSVMRFDVVKDHCICANQSVITYDYGAEYLCSSTDVHMVAQHGHTICSLHGSQRYLLKDEAVYADTGIRMNDDSVWMRNKEATTNLAVKINFCLCDDGPKAVQERPVSARHVAPQATAGA